MSKELLDTCLSITGAYENGKLAYDGLSGNFDGMGISCGVLQWNPGTGSLGSHLLAKVIELSGAEAVDSFFSVPVSSLATMSAPDQLIFITTHFLTGKDITTEGKTQWKAFLSSEPSVNAQVSLAENGVLASAMKLADQYISDGANNARVVAFFFDLVTQSGGMKNSRGSVDPYVEGDEVVSQAAIIAAQPYSQKTADLWTAAIQAEPLANLLLHYAYKRALLSRPEYVWDALSRRGAIACRGGLVHGKMFNFTQVLP
jgi:hypothetical protein